MKPEISPPVSRMRLEVTMLDGPQAAPTPSDYICLLPIGVCFADEE